MSAETTKLSSAPPVTTANVRIEITPSTEQYEQLCRDLAALRRGGADSNTTAVLTAVRAAAAAKLEGG